MTALRTRPLTIVVSGMVAGGIDQGGAAWAVMQYLLGLERLGHDVWYVESLKRERAEKVEGSFDLSPNIAWCRKVMSDCGFGSRWHVRVSGTRQMAGVDRSELLGLAGRADVLINISGNLIEPDVFERIPTRVYLDLDPAFVQLWHAVDQIDMRFDGHTHFVTVGQKIGSADCSVPTCGREWITTLPPIVLPQWPSAEFPHNNALTTVANWRSYGPIHHDGVMYGQKAHSFRQLFSLPELAPERFLLALGIHPDEQSDVESLSRCGWELVDPRAVAGSPQTYRRFVRRSKGEIGVAKSGYVVSRCGWFSDRSACYLASGRPVVAQETGFSDSLPVGEGLFAFTTIDDAVEAIAAINSDYELHSRAARTIAESHFDSDRVLTRLLRVVGVTT